MRSSPVMWHRSMRGSPRTLHCLTNFMHFWRQVLLSTLFLRASSARPSGSSSQDGRSRWEVMACLCCSQCCLLVELVQLPVHLSPGHRVHQVQAKVHFVAADSPRHQRRDGPPAETDHLCGRDGEQTKHLDGLRVFSPPKCSSLMT